MAIKAIAYSYWRSIKRGSRTFESISKSVKNDVLALAQTDLQNDVITDEEYKQYIGENYPMEEGN